MRLFLKNGKYYGIDVGQEHLIPEGSVETTQAERDALPENVKARKNAEIESNITAEKNKLSQELILAVFLRPNAAFSGGKKPFDIMLEIDNNINMLLAQKV